MQNMIATLALGRLSREALGCSVSLDFASNKKGDEI